MGRPAHRADEHHGLGEIGTLRHVLLLARLAAWALLGAWLLHRAQWPSTCDPRDLLEVYGCATRLPDSGRWNDVTLLAWLWSTPLLLILEAARRLVSGRLGLWGGL